MGSLERFSGLTTVILTSGVRVRKMPTYSTALRPTEYLSIYKELGNFYCYIEYVKNNQKYILLIAEVILPFRERSNAMGRVVFT